MTHTERKTCRSCGGKTLIPMLDFGNQWLVGFVEAGADPDTLPRAPLEWVRCEDCGLLQLAHTVKPDLLWRDYWYRSGVNKTMNDALADVVKDGLQYHKAGTWCDIGANDGTLLSKVPPGFVRVAVEPALNLSTLCQEHAHVVVPNYFKASELDAPLFHVITSCAMFYDLDDPHAFLEDIKTCLAPDGVWINQLSDTAQMLKQTAFDNICHEHACYYDLETLDRLYRQHGLTIVNVSLNDVNGGSMRVTATKRRDRGIGLQGVPTVATLDLQRFVRRVVRWKELMHALLDTMDGPVWLYGASTKAAMMLQYLDRSGRFIAAAERNPVKHGKIMVGPQLPIVDEGTFRREKPPWAIVGPWAFADEIDLREATARDAGTAFLYPLPHPRFVL